jgi:porin
MLYLEVIVWYALYTADEAKNQYDVAYKAGTKAEDRTYGGWIAFEQQLTS